MPIYVYTCGFCGHCYEVLKLALVEPGDALLPACPKCRADLMQEKQPASGGFVVKGYNAGNGYSGGKA